MKLHPAIKHERPTSSNSNPKTRVRDGRKIASYTKDGTHVGTEEFPSVAAAKAALNEYK